MTYASYVLYCDRINKNDKVMNDLSLIFFFLKYYL